MKKDRNRAAYELGIPNLDPNNVELADWMREDAEAPFLHEVGTDVYGNPRYQMSSTYNTDATDQYDADLSKQWRNRTVADESTRAAATSLQYVKDINARLAGLRTDLVDNPHDAEDDPTIEYELPNGTKFTEDERVAYFKLKDGTVAAEDEITDAFDNPVAYQLPSGERVPAASLQSYQGDDWEVISPDDPRASEAKLYEDGQYWYANSIKVSLPGGRTVTVKRSDFEKASPVFELADGTPISADSIPQNEDEWAQAFYQYRAPNRMTVIMNADGSVPDALENKIYTQEVGGGLKSALLGVARPRLPWQDKAGNYMWDEDFSVRHLSNPMEWTPALVDSLLQSAPYFVPKYNYLSGAAEVMPYTYGVDSASYQPAGRWLGNIGQIGTYGDSEHLNNSQLLGGSMAAVANAALERVGGVGLGAKAGRGFIPKPVMSAVREGMEEVGSYPFERLEQQGIDNYVYPQSFSGTSGEPQYDTDSTFWERAGDFTSGAGNNFLMGAWMGLGMETPSIIRNARMRRALKRAHQQSEKKPTDNQGAEQ